ncbi:TIGR03943 family putative permease subunit [Paenibacillus physcomitrellae]|uniref:Permease n=1 Tax=Paenibacillus physcomitrellae TaxID=1619311 RepID=A0ABQ1GL56_9BACL|nr:TIGR03943 family protein [Paenibacillus physcomitrellae]GGA45670.1 permease [Paenibacillus physcomitrellae]
MNISPSSRLHYGLQAALMFALALYIGSLVKTNALHYYLAPRMEKWMLLCPILLGLMAVFTAYRAIAPDDDPVCGCSHEVPKSLFKRMTIYVLFLLPVAFGALMPNRALGSAAASTKGFSLTSPLQEEHVSKEKAALRPAAEEAPQEAGSGAGSGAGAGSSNQAVRPAKVFTAPDEYNEEFAWLATLLYAKPIINVTPDIYSETIGAIELYKEDFIGKSISLTGFVYKDTALEQPAGEFAVGRFLVLCCTADALPFGVLVKSPQNAVSFNKDTWVKVTGKINVETVGGQQVLKIDAAQINATAQPSVPYVYPNADSVAAFEQDQNGNK